VTLFAVAALSSAPKDAGGDTGATEKAVTLISNPQEKLFQNLFRGIGRVRWGRFYPAILGGGIKPSLLRMNDPGF
jgi:hypothetical protein